MIDSRGCEVSLLISAQFGSDSPNILVKFRLGQMHGQDAVLKKGPPERARGLDVLPSAHEDVASHTRSIESHVAHEGAGGGAGGGRPGRRRGPPHPPSAGRT